MSSAVAVEHLADDRRHLRGADVETDQIPFFTRHSASGSMRQRRFAFALTGARIVAAQRRRLPVLPTGRT